jgi:hypothetical protein
MSTSLRLAAFLAGLAVLGALAFGLGSRVDVSAPGGGQEAAAMDAHDSGDTHGAESTDGGEPRHPVRGLGVSAGGLRLVVADPEWAAGAIEPLRFRIVDESGAPVTAFDLTHTKRMHVLVVRRDLTGFQHLHPALGADGTWTVPARLPEPGTYRVFADFSHRGEAVTLADDLRVDGDADLAALPEPATRALSQPGAFEVDLDAGDPHAGEPARLRFAVSRGGRPATLQPYLGAGGHLVALREGDLAFLHVHPTGDAGRDGSIAFEASFPTAGAYRLFLQFEVGGELQTVAFTEEVH